MSFAELKRKSKSDFEALANKLNNEAAGKAAKVVDTRFWSAGRDTAGNGFAIIRFLPNIATETVPYIKYWDHGFKGPGGWYIENSRSSLGEPDPLMELNGKLWNISNDQNSPTRKQAVSQKRRLHYVANVFIVSDPANPENEGKVFLFKFGKKIFDKLNDKMNPNEAEQLEGAKAVNVFDLWEGANFKLRIRQIDKTSSNPNGYTNYDKSDFDTPGPLFDDDDKLEEVYKAVIPLAPFVDPNGKTFDGKPLYKSYDVLKAHLEKVLGIKLDTSNTETKKIVPVEDEVAEIVQSKKIDTKVSADDDEDDDMALFRKLRDES